MTTDDEEPREDAPPFGRSWGPWYAVVLLTLALLVALFYGFTRLYETP
jgi:hypothetical protein